MVFVVIVNSALLNADRNWHGKTNYTYGPFESQDHAKDFLTSRVNDFFGMDYTIVDTRFAIEPVMEA